MPCRLCLYRHLLAVSLLGRRFLGIGMWHSYEKENNGLDIKDIVWPGHSHVPPQGVPEKFHLTVGFLEESPFVNLDPPDPVSGRCNIDRGVPCRVQMQQQQQEKQANSSLNSTVDFSYQCCSGFWYAFLHASHFIFQTIFTCSGAVRSTGAS